MLVALVLLAVAIVVVVAMATRVRMLPTPSLQTALDEVTTGIDSAIRWRLGRCARAAAGLLLLLLRFGLRTSTAIGGATPPFTSSASHCVRRPHTTRAALTSRPSNYAVRRKNLADDHWCPQQLTRHVEAFCCGGGCCRRG